MKIDFDRKEHYRNNACLMRCPKCGAQAADNAAFCPKCDHILDPSLFLDEVPPEVPVEDTNPGIRFKPPHPPPSSPAGARPSSRSPSSSSRRTAASSPKASAAKQAASSSVDATGEALPVQEEVSPQWKASKSEFNEAERLLASLKADFLELPGPDKLMMVGAIGMVLSCFFPWQTLERSGDVLGFLSLGVLVIPLAIGSFAGMLWRNRSYESLPLLPWLLQGLSGLIAVVFCMVLAKLFWISKSAAELAHVESSSPSLGLLMGLCFALLNLAGTVLGFKRDF